MEFILHAAKIISIVSFFIYGLSCILSKGMDIEFQRYGLKKFRLLTGCLQIAGSLGLTAGYFLPYVSSAASLGLFLLMLLGFITRIVIKDTLTQATPALFFCILNLFIFFQETQIL